MENKTETKNFESSLLGAIRMHEAFENKRDCIKELRDNLETRIRYNFPEWFIFHYEYGKRPESEYDKRQAAVLENFKEYAEIRKEIENLVVEHSPKQGGDSLDLMPKILMFIDTDKKGVDRALQHIGIKPNDHIHFNDIDIKTGSLH